MQATDVAPRLVRRHLCFGWWLILGFLTLGIGLESLHGLKIGWYLDVDHESRRLMLTLAHVHGTLLGLLHLGFGLSVRELASSRLKLASGTLCSASLLVPGGFAATALLGEGRATPGMLVVAAGALLLFIAVWFTARATRGSA